MQLASLTKQEILGHTLVKAALFRKRKCQNKHSPQIWIKAGWLIWTISLHKILLNIGSHFGPNQGCVLIRIWSRWLPSISPQDATTGNWRLRQIPGMSHNRHFRVISPKNGRNRSWMPNDPAIYIIMLANLIADLCRVIVVIYILHGLCPSILSSGKGAQKNTVKSWTFCQTGVHPTTT